VVLTPEYLENHSFEDSLDKYDENIEVEEYYKGEVSDSEKCEFLEYYGFVGHCIDERYQKQGYGRQALGLILDFIRSAPARQAKYVWLCYGLDNVVARKLYASIGFKEVPEAYLEEDEEMPAVLEL
jgi:RimJ/RimL family protein N-acetyltransferase